MYLEQGVPRMLRLCTGLLALALSACTGNSDDAPPKPKPEPQPTEPTGETGSEPTGETGTGPTGETAEPIPFDCTAVPSSPLGHTELQSPRGYHGLAIDPEGHIIGSDGNNLLKVTYDNQVTVFVPSLGQVQGMDWLPDGDLVVASDQYNALVRITPEGSVTPLATDIQAYGVVLGPDGMVYAANRDDVFRIDPSTGEKTLFVNGQNGLQAQSVNFSPDYTKFYMTSNFGYALWEMEVDKNVEPLGPPQRLADFGNSYRDALGVDWCGNMYVPDYGAGRLFRITPDGTVTSLVNFNPFSKYGHGLVFGTGVGDWKHDAIYMPQPYDNYTVVEIEIGVPGRSWTE
jgi:sugar lactone lactonase YvrE